MIANVLGSGSSKNDICESGSCGSINSGMISVVFIYKLINNINEIKDTYSVHKIFDRVSPKSTC